MTVTFAGQDGASGIASCTSPSYSGPDSATASVAGSCTDNAGNVGNGSFALKYDATKPTITDQSHAPAQPNGAGWYNAAVTETFQASDATSGIAGHGTTPYTFTVSSGTAEGSAVTIPSGNVSDLAGNVAAGINSAPYKIDLTPPTNVAGTPDRAANGAGWYNAPVTVNFGGQDTVSGIAACTSPSYSGPDSATASVAGTCTDNAGNSANGSFALKYDATKPTVTYSGNAGSYTVDQTVSITCAAADNLSGVASSTCQNIAGPAASFAPGVNTFSATATDTAGNVGTGRTSFTLVVNQAGIGKLLDRYVANPILAAVLKQQVALISVPGLPASFKAQLVQGFDDTLANPGTYGLTAQQAATLSKLDPAAIT